MVVDKTRSGQKKIGLKKVLFLKKPVLIDERFNTLLIGKRDFSHKMMKQLIEQDLKKEKPNLLYITNNLTDDSLINNSSGKVYNVSKSSYPRINIMGEDEHVLINVFKNVMDRVFEKDNIPFFHDLNIQIIKTAILILKASLKTSCTLKDLSNFLNNKWSYENVLGLYVKYAQVEKDDAKHDNKFIQDYFQNKNNLFESTKALRLWVDKLSEMEMISPKENDVGYLKLSDILCEEAVLMIDIKDMDKSLSAILLESIAAITIKNHFSKFARKSHKNIYLEGLANEFSDLYYILGHQNMSYNISIIMDIEDVEDVHRFFPIEKVIEYNTRTEKEQILYQIFCQQIYFGEINEKTAEDIFKRYVLGLSEKDKVHLDEKGFKETIKALKSNQFILKYRDYKYNKEDFHVGYCS